jgi:site-specific recombinase XerD
MDALLRSADPEPLCAFAQALAGKDPKTIVAYLGTLRDFVAWLATRPGGTPFQLTLLTETALDDYMRHLEQQQRAPRTRSRALSALKRFCRWAIDEGQLRRNPATAIQRPTVVALAPTELTPDQRYVLKTLVERADSPRLRAIVALGYWAGLRISEVAALQVDHCVLNQRAGAITIVGSKGGKTRTIDLHNQARRALYLYLDLPSTHTEAREPDSPYVFTSQRAAWLRQQQQPDHITVRGISHLWTQLKARATHAEWQLIEPITFHDLRHDWAHRARAAGWSLEEIAVYAGHQTKDGAPAIATTVRYTLPSRQQLKEQLQRLQG